MFGEGLGNLVLSLTLGTKRKVCHAYSGSHLDRYFCYCWSDGEQFRGPYVFVNMQITDLQFSHIVLRVPSLTKTMEQFLMSRIIWLRKYCDNQGGHLRISYMFKLKTQQNFWCGDRAYVSSLVSSLFLGSGDGKLSGGPCTSVSENCYSWRTFQNVPLWLHDHSKGSWGLIQL